MASFVVIFLIVLHLIAQVYAPTVDESSVATVPKLVQPVASTSPKLVHTVRFVTPSIRATKPPAGTKPKPKDNSSQAIDRPPCFFGCPAPAAQPKAVIMTEDLLNIAKKFHKEHASLLTPGVEINDFEVEKHLSTGDDGSVYIVRRIKDNAKFAMKEIYLTPETNFNELAEQIDIQVQATKDKRTHINNVFAVFLDQNKICMILGLMMEGDVDYNIPSKLTEKEFCSMTKGMMEDLAYLEKRGISHRDLDMSNLLFSNEKNEIVIDNFQRATKQKEFSCKYHALHAPYAPPEWKQRRTDIKCTNKVDVYAIGVFLSDIKRHITPRTELSGAFKLMLSPNPALRPSFSEMLSSKIFQQC